MWYNENISFLKYLQINRTLCLSRITFLCFWLVSPQTFSSICSVRLSGSRHYYYYDGVIISKVSILRIPALFSHSPPTLTRSVSHTSAFSRARLSYKRTLYTTIAGFHPANHPCPWPERRRGWIRYQSPHLFWNLGCVGAAARCKNNVVIQAEL